MKRLKGPTAVQKETNWALRGGEAFRPLDVNSGGEQNQRSGKCLYTRATDVELGKEIREGGRGARNECIGRFATLF